MKKKTGEYHGIEELVKKYKAAFRIPENIHYYSEKDYKIAERKYIKNAVKEGKMTITHNHPIKYG